MSKEEFGLRLAQLRSAKNVSAREMSLSIGQNTSYINNIENGRAMPSMVVFFYICEYLGITPAQFFDTDSKNPKRLEKIISDLKRLDDEKLESISKIVNGLIK